MATADNLQELYEKFLLGQCSALETQKIITLMGTADNDVLAELVRQKLDDEKAIVPENEAYQLQYDRILMNLKKEMSMDQPHAGYKWWKIAAVALLTLSVGLSGYLYFTQSASSPLMTRIKPKVVVKPGGNKAYLILSGGQKIALANVAEGILDTSSGEHIRKTADGEIVYDSRVANSGKEGGFNLLQTPKGGQYTVILPDGTHVWLNAASSLKYAASFKNQTQRHIQLTGEAYFEVAKDPTRPFIVQTDDQQIKVLGTHFNVNSYHDEGGSKTTLLEGRISASSGTSVALVHPGQQVLTHGNKILKVTEADTELAIAWKNDQFMFDSMPLKVLMQNLARWYDVEISYAPNLPDVHFNGSVSKFEDISFVLRILESTGKVHFKMEDRKVQVTQ